MGGKLLNFHTVTEYEWENSVKLDESSLFFNNSRPLCHMILHFHFMFWFDAHEKRVSSSWSLSQTGQNMSWASLTRKLGRSRSVSAWSIKSGTKSVPISEETVISSVIGSLLSTSILTKICDTT